MVKTLEAIKGGGGSIRVGTVGTIGSLMTRELESSNPTTHTPSSSRHTHLTGSNGNGPLKPRTSMDESTNTRVKHRSPEAVQKTRGQNQHRFPVTITTTPKRPKQQAPLEYVGNSTVNNGTSRSDFSGKARSHKRSYHIPMLSAENIHLEKTPSRDKPMRKGSNIVDIVDINCGNPGGSLSNRLKKLGFSKLSQSFM